MPRSLPQPTPTSRYSYAAAAKEIESAIDGLKETGAQKQIAAEAGLDESGFSHRLIGRKSRFTVEHFGCIADSLEKRGVKLPDGWPLVPRRRKR